MSTYITLWFLDSAALGISSRASSTGDVEANEAGRASTLYPLAKNLETDSKASASP